MATDDAQNGRDALASAIAKRVADGAGVALEGPLQGVVVSELPSGTRFAIDTAGAYWALDTAGQPPARYASNTNPSDEMPNGTESRFAEALEVPRHEFEDGLEAGARATGLPEEPARLAFPALELIRAVLGMSSAYTSRLALRWMLPSERAELAPSIARVAKDQNMTQDVRDLARHLTR